MAKKYIVGYNYWSSDAGCYMWERFNPECIEKDMALLKEYKVNCIRIFPIWPVFQPIKMYYEYLNAPYEIRYTNDRPLDGSEEGVCGIDVAQVEKMQFLLDCAHKNGIKVVFSILSGWMSSRLFVPPALEGKNVMTDPLCLKWEIRFVRYMVKRFCDHPAIYAWGLGNECDCIAEVPNDMPYVWVHMIASTIRQYDKNHHPVMNDLALHAPYKDGWSILEEGELVDILVTHPYNVFQPDCLYDKTMSFRSLMHMSMETWLNQSISGCPAFIEEIGTIGPMMGGGDTQARFMNVGLHEGLSRGFIGFMPWCTFDQYDFDYPPYDWSHLERELGAFKPDYTPNPHATVLKKFAEDLEKFNIPQLPIPAYDAVCILSHRQNTWRAAYGAYALARQLDLNLQFTLPEQDLPDSKLYILPSIDGNNYVLYSYFKNLLKKVYEGATLFVSLDSKVFMTNFENLTGLFVEASLDRPRTAKFEFMGEKMELNNRWTYLMKSTSGKVLTKEENGNVVINEKAYGKGRIITMTMPLETYLGAQPDVLSSNDACMYNAIYKYVAEDQLKARKVEKTQRYLLKSEHILEDGRFMLILSNPNDWTLTDTLTLKDGLTVDVSTNEGCIKAVTPGTITVELKSGEGAILFLK